VRNLTHSTLLFAIALTLAGAAVDAGTHTKSSSHQPSSYAPRKHSTSHVYGSPIGHPAISRTPHHQSFHHPSSHRTVGVTRDSHGKIKRSAKAKDDFHHAHPCPATGRTSGACSGYVIDHVQALKHGGTDAPSNMQWQTNEAAKAKDKVE
jgi:hypothetical protein